MELTLDVVKKLVPRQFKDAVTDSMVDILNKAVDDPKVIDAFRENFISYLSVFREGKYKLEDYVKAIKFVSYKLLNYSDIDAYVATFPDRYQRLIDEGVTDVSPYVSMYRKGKLVISIMEQTIVPSYILNAPYHQEAVNQLYKIMTNEREKGLTRVKAAETLLNYTKPPEVKKSEMAINIGESDTLNELKKTMEDLAKTQIRAIEKGYDLKSVAESRIIGEVIDIEAEEIVDDNDSRWSI